MRGRPKKYTPEFIEDLRIKLDEWIKIPTNWWICDFAIENDIWEQRIYDFAKQDEDFLESLKKAEQIQKSRLVKLGLGNKVNATMAIFALKNVAGWRNEKETEDADLTKGEVFEFSGVPSNGDGKERFKQYLN